MNNKVKLKTKVSAKKAQSKAKSSVATCRGAPRYKSKVPIKHVEGMEIKVEDTISADIEKLQENPQKELENFIASLTGKGVGETVKFKPKGKTEKNFKENSISMMTTISPEKENIIMDSKIFSKEAESGQDEEEDEESFQVIVEKQEEQAKEKETPKSKEFKSGDEKKGEDRGEKKSVEVEELTIKITVEKTKVKAKAKKKQPKMEIDHAAAEKSDQVLESFAKEPKTDAPSVVELHKLIDDITKNIEKTRKSRKVAKTAVPAAKGSDAPVS